MPRVRTKDMPEGYKLVESLSIGDVHYDYDYPYGLDLRPNVPDNLHSKLVQEILRRAQAARDAIEPRFDIWDTLDRSLTAYVSPEDAAKVQERWTTGEDDDVSEALIVIPIMYMKLDIYLTFLSNVFFDSPTFRYRGQGPRDILGTLLLEKVMENQVQSTRMGLNLHTFWRDGIVYNAGFTLPRWVRKTRARARRESFYGGIFGEEGTEEEKVIFEGNQINNIDPRLALPDPNTPLDRIHEAEYFGWVQAENRMRLLEEERSLKGTPEGLCNCLYLRHTQGTSQYYERFRDDPTGHPGRDDESNTTTPTDVLYMFIDLVPYDWELGDSKYPTIYFMGLAGDEVIIQMTNTGLHEIPVSSCVPNYDGYSVTNTSILEVSYGLQKSVDWHANASIANKRKAIYNMFAVDPSLINMNDLNSAKPGLKARLRKSAWGREGAIKNAIQQLNVHDVTQNFTNDIAFLMGIDQRIHGITDPLQGIMRQGSERRSATEFQGTMGSALNRVKRLIQIIDLMSMQRLGYLLAQNCQDYMTQELFIQVTDDWEDVLREEYGIPRESLSPYTGNRYPVLPSDLDINFDVTSHTAMLDGQDNADTVLEFLRICATNPLFGMQFDAPRIGKHWARLRGFTDVSHFVNREMAAKAKLMQDEMVAQQLEAGNLVPAGGQGETSPNR